MAPARRLRGHGQGDGAVESFRLETIGELRAVATQFFIPFAVTRLRERPEDTDMVLTIELRGIENRITERR
jgi:hypothetical protein